MWARAASRIVVPWDARLLYRAGMASALHIMASMALQEAMRMRPVVPSGYARVVARDVRLSNGLVLPRGATLTGSNLATLNSPEFWDQPERFMPVAPVCQPHGF